MSVIFYLFCENTILFLTKIVRKIDKTDCIHIGLLENNRTATFDSNVTRYLLSDTFTGRLSDYPHLGHNNNRELPHNAVDFDHIIPTRILLISVIEI